MIMPSDLQETGVLGFLDKWRVFRFSWSHVGLGWESLQQRVGAAAHSAAICSVWKKASSSSDPLWLGGVLGMHQRDQESLSLDHTQTPLRWMSEFCVPLLHRMPALYSQAPNGTKNFKWEVNAPLPLLICEIHSIWLDYSWSIYLLKCRHRHVCDDLFLLVIGYSD